MIAVVRTLGNRRTAGRSFPLALFILVSAFLVSTSARANLALEPVSASKNSLAIAVDPRIELVSIVQYLSAYRKADPSLVTSLDQSYRKDVDDWFSKYKSHAAIELFNRMSSQKFSYDAPPHAALYLNADLTLDSVIFKDDPLDVERAGGRRQMLAFAGALRAFALESGFAEFYTKHNSFYQRITQETLKKLGSEDIIKQLEQYYGEKKSRYAVILSPLLGGHCFGPQVERIPGSKEVYCIIGPWSQEDGVPQFGSSEYFQQLQWHEFGHSFVNPMVAKYSRLWEKHADLFSPMESKMKSHAYGQWFTVVCESTLRAATARLVCRYAGQDAGKRALQREMTQGFVFTGALVKKLEDYETNRSKYPTLDSFFPELIKALDGFTVASVRDAIDDVDFLIINKVTGSVGAVVCDVPDAEGRANAVDFVGQVHDRFYGKLELLNAASLDDATLKAKLKGGFILYTTIGSKLFKATTEPLNIRIDESVLTWNGISAPASELRIILVGKNPYGDGDCVVFAAGCNKLLTGINSCYHGPCSYHVFQNTKLLKEGFYNKEFSIKALDL